MRSHCAVQRLDRRVVAEGEDRVAVVPAAARAVPDRAQVELGVDGGDDLLAADVLVEDVGVRGGAAADLGQRPEQAGGRPSRLLGADREGDLGMVLVGGAGVEIAGRRGERQQHQQQEAGERAPVPRRAAGAGSGARRGAGTAAPARPRPAPAAAPRRRLGAASRSAAPAAAGLGRRRLGRGRLGAGSERGSAAQLGAAARGAAAVGRPGVASSALSSALSARRPHRRPRPAGLVIAAPAGLPLAPDESKPRAATAARGSEERDADRGEPGARRGASRRRSGPAGRGSSGCG